VKPLYAAAGALALALGVAGIFLPLLPTTPFLLLASWCFLRGSPAAHRWMHSHPRFGPYLTAYEEGRGIPLRAKVVALATMWLSIGATSLYVGIAWAAAAMVGVAIGVTIYLLRLPTLGSP
jgi:uncharacterized membrane protein YbaN (DUF454 family)